MRLSLTLALASAMAVAMATPSKAVVLDVSDLTCKDVLELKSDDLSAVMMWTHGYFGGKAGDTKIDFKSFEAAGKAIGEYCGANPTANWLEAIEKLGS